jgi:hypothetical protein
MGSLSLRHRIDMIRTMMNLSELEVDQSQATDNKQFNIAHRVIRVFVCNTKRGL